MNRIFVLINITILLISCSGSDENRDLKVFRYNCENNITSLDPAFASTQDNIWAVHQIFSGLTELDENLTSQPGIAHRWNISADGKIYTFYLRDNVRFHPDKELGMSSARKVTAQDFVFSFNRIMDPKTASPGAWIFNDKVDSNAFSAPNDSTFIIRLKQPFAPFLGILSMPYCSVVQPEAISYYRKEAGTHPIGTGPFRFKQWEKDVALYLNENPDYFKKSEISGNADAIKITFIQNRQMALMLFLEGELDMCNGLTGAVKDYILTPEGKLKPELKEKFHLEIAPFLNTEYLAFFVDADHSEFPVNNEDFRQALSFSVDRKEMIRHLRNNLGHPADGGFIPVGLTGYSTVELPFNMEKARELIETSGYLKQPVELVLTTTRDYTDLCIYVQKQFREIGVKCAINTIPSSQLKEEKRNGKLSFFRASWIMDYPDAENYLSCFYSGNFSPSGPNYTHFSNAEFDRLYEEALEQSDEEKRSELYRDMDSIILKQAPVIVLFYDESLRLTSKRISGMKNNPLNIPEIRSVIIH
ncbi:MAG: ABC transporter substrate-binding protein [Bacteroidetes bacterium]|nr:ABC transporter substrate-binding protein [Bacteroidota bacterium]